MFFFEEIVFVVFVDVFFNIFDSCHFSPFVQLACRCGVVFANVFCVFIIPCDSLFYRCYIMFLSFPPPYVYQLFLFVYIPLARCMHSRKRTRLTAHMKSHTQLYHRTTFEQRNQA